MSDSTTFDSHRHVKELVAHGLSEASAETIVNVVQDGSTHHVDTKADLAEFRLGIQEQLTKLDGRVTNIEDNMATKTDLALLEARLIKWNIATMMVFGSILIAAAKLL